MLDSYESLDTNDSCSDFAPESLEGPGFRNEYADVTRAPAQTQMPPEVNVTVTWDPEADVWIATSDDVPGLFSEDRSLDGLVERVVAVLPELIEPESPLASGAPIPVTFHTQGMSSVMA